MIRKQTRCACVLAVIAGVLQAQTPAKFDFANLIQTTAGMQQALERCDGHPAFETALANWLETAEPRSPQEVAAIRKTSLALLEDTTDSQIVLGLIDGLLRHAVDGPGNARKLYADIAQAAGGRASKMKVVPVLASELAANAKDPAQARFLAQVLNLAEPGVTRRAQAADRQAKPAQLDTSRRIPVALPRPAMPGPQEH